MSSKRAPAPPPQLAGFSYQQVLGSGGFADVYLYEQALPRRRVAVKVLLAEKMTGGAREQFQAEANVMAMLSTHPAIVTIYQAGVSDDGRSYLVMEYCSKPNLQVRARSSPISVAEALRVGIQVAAAVETAHRAGILHRDIKPANILVTEYNRPALTDFGIATTADGADPAAGMSIPWSPPESFADNPEFTVRSDVWALGATVYNLLSGRSPFEVPGGRNGGAELIRRIEGEPLPRLERPDAPASLQLVLERAMAKRAGDRFESAVAFARALQKVQIELAHSVTPIDILDDSPPAEEEEDDGELTRVRGIVSIDPHTAPAAGPTWERSAYAAQVQPETTGADATMLRAPTSIPPAHTATTAVDDGTIVRGPRSVPPQGTIPGATASAAPAATAPGMPPGAPSAPAATSRRGLWVGLGIAAAAIVIVGIVATASLLAPPPDETSPAPSTSAAPPQPQDPVAGFVPAPEDGSGRIDGDQVVFRWNNPDPQDGDSFIWQRVRLDGGGGDARNVPDPTVTVSLDGDTQVCIDVALRRADGTVSQESRICVAE
ncbi:serine/threonine-protein kinase [Microbacterium sp. 179-B 1A2 NHS]|uniref:serine/threonine-protein kinase n=1 Tax=Microbacterium sp. 179-B 1A2 NHS TaxID=3142383 RepID=UPI0039A3F658